MYQVEAMIHSLNGMDTVTIIENNSNNNIVVEYNGHRYSAIYNMFTGLYYVDDLYGLRPDSEDDDKR